MRAFLRMWWEPANQQGTIVGLGSLAVLAVLLTVALFIQGDPAQADGPRPPVSEQYPGHISSDSMHDGISTIDLTVHGSKVTCIYAQNTKSGIGVSITCDWQHQR